MLSLIHIAKVRLIIADLNPMVGKEKDIEYFLFVKSNSMASENNPQIFIAWNCHSQETEDTLSEMLFMNNNLERNKVSLIVLKSISMQIYEACELKN